jgi:signal transduction histidine kinase
VRIRGHHEEAYTVLTVEDNGLGLEPAQQAELFTMFRRFHAHVPGSGIGLNMVKRMVENAGGRIAVRSEPGVGSTFAVYFRR